MDDVVNALERSAREIREQNIVGWGNAIDAGIEEITRLRVSDNEAKNLVSSLEEKIAELRAEVKAARKEGLEMAAKYFEEHITLLDQMRAVYPGDPTGEIQDDIERIYSAAAAIRALAEEKG